MRNRLLLFSVLIISLAFPYLSNAESSSSKFVWYSYDPNSGATTYELEMEDGGIYYVPFGVAKDFYIEGDGFNIDGDLYFLNPETGQRELVEYSYDDIFGTPRVSWEKEGIYEVDIYDFGEPQLEYSPFIRKFLAGLFHSIISTAYAQTEDRDEYPKFIETISFTILEERECCSSVAFIPGLEASRLYKEGVLFENQLWTPNNSNDVNALKLSSTTGESLDSGIYTRDVIDEAYMVNIYKTFLVRMNEMVLNGDIQEFEALPYDWRMDVKDVATNPIALKNGTYAMIARIEQMASSSLTKKVTLIAHSNGGLVAKELINELERQGKANLIDQVVMVATPQLGTPAAIMEMLHGMDPYLLNFPNKESTRELAENMKSAYTLLPSRAYFDALEALGPVRPVIEFDENTLVTQAFRNIYDNSISNYDILRKFLRGEYGGRTEPSPSDTQNPNVLKESFLTNAETRHLTLDQWIPPTEINVIEVVGWGLDTIRGIRYSVMTKKVCNENQSVCQNMNFIDPQPLITSEGDATVVGISADHLGGERDYMEIDGYNDQRRTINRSHKNILEIDSLQTLIKTLIKHEATSTLPEFIRITSPLITNASKRLRAEVHSPVAIHLYEGPLHTGLIPNPDTDSDLKLYEEQIPNSYYWQIGEGQYVGSTGTSTTIELKGLNLGTFTLAIHEVVADETTGAILYEDIPVTASTTASITIEENAALVLKLDIDSDGTVDTEIDHITGISDENLLQILKGIILTLNLPEKKKKRLIKILERIEKILETEKKCDNKKKDKNKKKCYANNDKRLDKVFDRLITVVERFKERGILSEADAAELLKVILDIKREMVE